MGPFQEAYLRLRTQYAEALNELGGAGLGSLDEIYRAMIDMRNYIILGDPAVRLRAGLFPEDT